MCLLVRYFNNNTESKDVGYLDSTVINYRHEVDNGKAHEKRSVRNCKRSSRNKTHPQMQGPNLKQIKIVENKRTRDNESTDGFTVAAAAATEDKKLQKFEKIEENIVIKHLNRKIKISKTPSGVYRGDVLAIITQLSKKLFDAIGHGIRVFKGSRAYQ